MRFSSLPFLFGFLPITLAIYFAVPLRWRNLALLLTSLVFYGWGEPIYISIMVLSILIDYTHGLLVEKYRSRDKLARWFVAESVLLNLGLLGFFKYWDFFAANLSLIPGVSIPTLGLPLPIGISFFTFQTMSYTIDVYRQDAPAQRNMVSFGAYVTMFPQLVAGPIVRYKDVAAELVHRTNTASAFAAGARRFTVGVGKKVLLANRIGALGDADNVIYEICNEPNGSTSWADIKAYAEAVIPIIRANDPDAVIVVGTPTWSQDLAAAAADPLPDANVMYALHFYAATHEDDLRHALSTAVAGGLPVFVTEFGICEASGAGEIDYASANLWVRLMNELDVSYICWNLSNKDETAALFKPGCAKTSGFTLDDLTDEGLWLVDTLKSPGFSREEVALARAEVKDNSAGAQMLVSADDTLQWTFQVADRWEEGGRSFFRYEMAGSNYSAGVKSWSVTVPFNGEVTLEDAWNCQASASGTRLAITNDAHNGNVPAGAFVRDVGFIVSGPADLAVVEYE